VIRVNNRKVLDGVMETIGIGGDDHAGTRLSVLRAIDKLDKFGLEGIIQLLGPGRKDESGDFTRGAGLSNAQINRIINLTGWLEPGSGSGGLSNAVTVANLEDYFELDTRGRQGVEELEAIARLCGRAGYDETRIRIDPSVVRGLEYYTGPVYECELTFDVTNEKGETIQFGSVAGGGRYDGLVQRFTGQQVPATGFSIGVSRLMTALKNRGKLKTKPVPAPVVVCVMDRDPISLGNYQKMVQALRQAGIRAELYQGNPKQFGKQLQYADRRGSAVAVIQGSLERAEGQVLLKDLIAGAEASKTIESREEWVEQKPAQVSVAEADLVAEVRNILARYGD
ncbi:MAG: ATP phosphoribosyltransferase regulatory subunit, partial [Anderseniella sp.]